MGIVKVTADISIGLNDGAPAADAPGLPLSGVEWYEVELDAPAGQTFTASPGTLKAYRQVGAGTTPRPVAELDIALPASLSGGNTWSSADIQVGVGVGTIIYRSSSLGVSGGTVPTLRYRYKKAL